MAQGKSVSKCENLVLQHEKTIGESLAQRSEIGNFVTVSVSTQVPHLMELTLEKIKQRNATRTRL